MDATPLIALVHGHHATLISWGRGLDERIAEVCEIKPKHEIEERIRHMWVPTPEQLEELPQAVRDAYHARYNAYLEWDYASTVLNTALNAGYQVLPTITSVEVLTSELFEAQKEWDKKHLAWAEADMKLDSLVDVYRQELNAWHSKHCKIKNCRWNGERLIGIGD